MPGQSGASLVGFAIVANAQSASGPGVQVSHGIRSPGVPVRKLASPRFVLAMIAFEKSTTEPSRSCSNDHVAVAQVRSGRPSGPVVQVAPLLVVRHQRTWQPPLF